MDLRPKERQVFFRLDQPSCSIVTVRPTHLVGLVSYPQSFNTAAAEGLRQQFGSLREMPKMNQVYFRKIGEPLGDCQPFRGGKRGAESQTAAALREFRKNILNFGSLG
jgi:hypothetical protein